MWKFEHTQISEIASPEQVWTIWSDVENWPQWDPQIEWSRCIGNFSNGSTIELKPVSAPKTKGKITECKNNQTFTVVASLALGTSITFVHNVESYKQGIKLHHSVLIAGPFTSVFKGLIGKHIESNLPIAMENLLKLVETKFS